MLSARALMFDEPSSGSSYDRDLLKLSTSPKQQQQQHHQVNYFHDCNSIFDLMFNINIFNE